MTKMTRRFLCMHIATMLILMIFTNCISKSKTHDDETDYSSLMFHLLHTGSRNIDICVIFYISAEGVLTYTMTNNTSYVFGYGADDATDLFRKTNYFFYRIHRGGGFYRSLLYTISPHFISTYDVNIGNVFFKENQVTPGIFKFIKEFIFVQKDWEDHQWHPLDVTYIYAIFEVKQR